MVLGIDRRVVGWIAASVWMAGVSPATAQSAALQWHCWVDGSERLRCVLDAARADGSPNDAPRVPAFPDLSLPPPSSPPAIAGSGSGSVAVATAPAPARKLPPIVAQLRDQPQTLAGQVIAIPLYSVTDDWPRVTQLARAVLCTSSLPCGIRLSTSLNDALSKGLDTDRLFVGPDLGWIGQTSMR